MDEKGAGEGGESLDAEQERSNKMLGFIITAALATPWVCLTLFLLSQIWKP